MLRLCVKCPNSGEVNKILRKNAVPELLEGDCFSSDEEYDFYEEAVKFRQWKSTDRTEMVVEVASRSEVIDIATKKMLELIPHNFIACSQRDYVKKLKADLSFDKVVVAMDFSMNYNCLVQGAVQSYHWSPKQATVHPTVIYFKTENNDLDHTSIIFISDDLEHDVPLVKKIQEKTAAFIRNKMPQVKEIEYVTDGCCSQYKSKGYFLNLCRHEQDFGLKASHTYFATSHGKSQCDADGGSVKRKARKASLQRPLDNQIISAQDLYEFLIKEHKGKFVFQFVDKAEVMPERKIYHDRMKTLETVPGTRSFHHIKPEPGKIFCAIKNKY
jgi:hypothetical protein